MYNFGCNTGCATPSVGYSYPAPYGLPNNFYMQRAPVYPVAFGADAPPKDETLTDKVKRVLGEQNSLTGVKNGYLLGGAAALGLLYYGSTHRWFK